jgi:hypothetical protein
MFSLKLTKIAIFAVATLVAGGAASSAYAESYWDATHPRRDEVNDRLANQNRRIDQERRDGQIGRDQARREHREDRGIRGEERRMASRDGGHITRRDQHILNHQENRVSHQIGRH